MTTVLRVLLIPLTHPVGFISTGRIKSHRAARCDTKGIQTDGTCNCSTGTSIQPDGSARNCFHEKLRYTRYGSFYSISCKSSTKKLCRAPGMELHRRCWGSKVSHTFLRAEPLFKLRYPTISYAQVTKIHLGPLTGK